MQVWSHSHIKSNCSMQMTANILTKGMYDFHKDLPLKINEEKRFIPACVDCIYTDAEVWPLTEEERVAAL